MRTEARFPAAWAVVVLLCADVCRDGGGAFSENSPAGPPGRDSTAEPGLPRLLLGLCQTGPGGPAEGGRKPHSVPENQQPGEIESGSLTERLRFRHVYRHV